MGNPSPPTNKEMRDTNEADIAFRKTIEKLSKRKINERSILSGMMVTMFSFIQHVFPQPKAIARQMIAKIETIVLNPEKKGEQKHGT